MNNLSYTDFWPQVLAEPKGVYYLIEEGDIWRVATTPILQNATSGAD